MKVNNPNYLNGLTVSAEQINAAVEGGGTSLTTEQTAAIAKIEGLEASASEIDNMVTNGATQSDLDALALSTGNLTEAQVTTIDNLSGLTVSAEEMNSINSNIVASKNLFNKNDIKLNYTITGAGTLLAYTGTVVSNYIPILPSTSYAMSTIPVKIVFYKQDNTYLSVSGSPTKTFTTPSSAYYMYIVDYIANIDLPTFQLEKGTVSTDYSSFDTKKFSFDVIYDFNGEVKEVVKTMDISSLQDDYETIPVSDDEAEHFDILGNPYLIDNTWKNATLSTIKSRVYPIDHTKTYDLMIMPNGHTSEQFVTSLTITEQIPTGFRYQPLTYNALTHNNLSYFADDITVNGYTVKRGTITNWTPPAEINTLVVLLKENGNEYNNIRLFERKGAKGFLSKNPNASKKIVVCGDSVSQNPESERGKERLRDSLGCTVDTYGIGGAGFSINATPTWVTTNNVSGVYQVEELVKTEAEVYDIYCLSCTLNDPITHQKSIGTITNCYPYLKTGSLPDFTDPNLDTMLGAINFCIQRIYEKNPKAKIVIGTMNKCFLTATTSGYTVDAGYNPDNTSVNIKGFTYYAYVEAVKSLGKFWGIPIVDVYGEAGINQLNKSVKMVDAYHPSKIGYDSIWNLWYDAILKA